ncbi:unnamed protein product [Didymodactylos carnosus]|uniref:TRAF-type domain-containing protein n=1 Tax=Didymodactylos carnosus TaxID=1234261 RepID=A0A8S2DC96_9BILA|nr:unnamed protein product [Didymodactylos carnosus]CAF3644435.1 unnamed protein product [Didymodactylos carnosus]
MSITRLTKSQGVQQATSVTNDSDDHTFCRRCILSKLTTHCPIDNQLLHAVVNNIIINEQIADILIWCKYSCKKLSSSIDNKYIHDDENGCQMKIQIGKRAKHEDVCEYVFVTCPNGCSQIRKKDLEEHISHCHYTEPCPNFIFGCQYQSDRHNISFHAQTCTYYTNQICNEQLEDEIQLLKHDLHEKTQQIEFLTTAVSQLSEKIRESDKEIDELKESQNQLKITNDLIFQELQTLQKRNNLYMMNDLQLADESENFEQSYVALRCNGTFAGHTDTVWSLFACENTLISGSSDKTIKIWNLHETPYSNLVTLHGHTDGILSLTVKENTLFSGGMDKSICVWNIDSYEKTASFNAHTAPVCSLAYFNNYLFSSSNKSVKIWDMNTLTNVNEIKTNDGWMRVLLQSENKVYAGCRRVVNVFDAINHRTVVKFELPTNESIYSLAYNSSRLFAGTLSGTIYTWDIRMNQCLEPLYAHESTVHGILYHSMNNKMTLISVSSDRTLKIWDSETFELLQCICRHEAEVTALHANERHVFSGSADTKIKVWDCIESTLTV